jgi:Flp pilus assembly protein TadD
MSTADDRQKLQAAFHHHRAGDLAKAAALYSEILQKRPDDRDALHYLGVIKASAGDLAAARSLMARSLGGEPARIEFIENYATVLVQLGDCEAALQACEQGLRLNPVDVTLLYASAVALLRLNRPREALEQFDRVLAVAPGHTAAVNERGTALVAMKRFDEALAGFGRALALQPRYAEAHYNEALCRLLTGDFAGGWEKNEWRWQIANAQSHKRNFAKPQWNGQDDITAKTILLHTEQGFGDAIQFCRYVPLVAARAGRVILEVPESLRELMGTLSCTVEIVSRGEPLPPFDVHCPLLSLPLAFRTRLDTIPSAIPYLRAPPRPARHWQTDGHRIGLVWSGSLTNKDGYHRSIGLGPLLPLLDLDASFVSLQKDVRPEDAALLKQRGDRVQPAGELKTFADTAALIGDLDLVITIDTSVAHLAGAMGKPVWILLMFAADWRWLLDRDDSPWYPTARLFRQDDSRTWNGVVVRVREALRDYLLSA